MQDTAAIVGRKRTFRRELDCALGALISAFGDFDQAKTLFKIRSSLRWHAGRRRVLGKPVRPSGQGAGSIPPPQNLSCQILLLPNLLIFELVA